MHYSSLGRDGYANLPHIATPNCADRHVKIVRIVPPPTLKRGQVAQGGGEAGPPDDAMEGLAGQAFSPIKLV
jgi:hypothetical protein